MSNKIPTVSDLLFQVHQIRERRATRARRLRLGVETARRAVRAFWRDLCALVAR
jgi:hypothetical protein